MTTEEKSIQVRVPAREWAAMLPQTTGNGAKPRANNQHWQRLLRMGHQVSRATGSGGPDAITLEEDGQTRVKFGSLNVTAVGGALNINGELLTARQTRGLLRLCLHVIQTGAMPAYAEVGEW